MGMSEPRHSIPARIVAALLVVLVAASAALALGARPAAADDVADEARLFQLTNESRLANGRGPLTYDPAASAVARSWAAELARSGDAVVLSPACASYDMFQNFGHRGRVFRDAVGAVGARRLDIE